MKKYLENHKKLLMNLKNCYSIKNNLLQKLKFIIVII